MPRPMPRLAPVTSTVRSATCALLQRNVHGMKHPRDADVEARGERELDDLGLAEALPTQALDAAGRGAGGASDLVGEPQHRLLALVEAWRGFPTVVQRVDLRLGHPRR